MKGKKAAIATGLGLAAASLLAAPQADAATEIAQVAGDGRIGTSLVISSDFAPRICTATYLKSAHLTAVAAG